jgi:hypothetical protein
MYKINDILFTKDGRKIGNVTIIDIVEIHRDTYYKCITDYGNILDIDIENPLSNFFKSPGKANESHKFYNYKEKHPELFV